MSTIIRPRLIVSRCLGFAACRYNGQGIADPLVAALRPLCACIPVCAECEIGLGVPREPVRMIQAGNALTLQQPATGREVTREMLAFCHQWLGEQNDIDGFLLKSKSPSCGIKDVKIYPSAGKVPALGRSAGMFGMAVLERFPAAAIEDEARLTNFAIREHFLAKLWTLARFRTARAKGKTAALVAFHAAHKYLLLAMDEKQLRLLGRLVANPDKRPPAEIFADYAAGLTLAFDKPARPGTVVNVLQHVFGYASDKITPAERRHFLSLVGQYREGALPLSAVTSLLQSWVMRFDLGYLAGQAFFAPYPEALRTVLDSGRGRGK